MMQFFNRCEANTGKLRWIDMFDAGAEVSGVTNINGQFRRRIMLGQKLKNKALYQKIKEIKLDVIKDPQFIQHPAIINHWVAIRRDVRIIVLLRSYEDIAQSMKRHPEMNTPAYRCFPELIEKKVKEFIKRLERIGVTYKVFTFPDFIDQPKEVIRTAKKFGCKLPRDAFDIWQDTWEKDKVHV